MSSGTAHIVKKVTVKSLVLLQRATQTGLCNSDRESIRVEIKKLFDHFKGPNTKRSIDM